MRQCIIWLIIFSVAMGYFEAAVVIYLREIYYPGGFAFPLVVMPGLSSVELLREAATVFMLAGVGILAGQTRPHRLAFFLTAFAVWDLFYYVFLKVFLNWPPSLLTWDILFLIPVPWIGPVLTPCIVSITMLVLAFVLWHRDNALVMREWLVLIAGSLIVIVSWAIDFLRFGKGMEPMTAFATFIPNHFNWYLFGAGELILAMAIVLYWNRTSNRT